MSSEEDVLFQVSNVKYKKDEGTLYMMSQRLAWIQENRDTVSVSHHYADIKSQKISPEGKPKIQLQIVLNDSSTFTFQFVHPEGVQTQFALRNQVKEMLLKLLPKFKRQANPELEEKNILLRDNPILTQLYRDLVITDIVTSDEFWKNHAAKYIAEKPSEDLNQALGISSGFLTGIQPATDGVNGIVYNLTSELMDSIFRTYPAVGRKHKECVPMLMSESEFWAKFFQSHYFHRDRLPVSKDVFYSCAKSDDKDMRNEVHALRRSNREIVALIDEAEREESGFTGMSLADPKDVESPGVTAHRNMIKRFNQHSIMLLKASLHNCNSLHQVAEKVNEPEQPKKKRKKDKVLEELVPETAIELLDPALVQENSIKLNNKIELHDLKTLSQPDFQKLHLSKVGRYLNGPVPVYQSTRISMEEVTRAIHGMRESVSRWHAKPYLLDAKMAATLIGELSPGGAIMKTNIPDANSQVVPQEVETELRNTYLSLCELLRHFWSFFPISSPEDTQKLKKCQETLKKFEVVKLQQLKERLLRDHLSLNLMSHLNEMISATEVKYSRSFAVFNKPKRDVRKAFKSMTLPSATVFHLSIDDFLRIFIRTRELDWLPSLMATTVMELLSHNASSPDPLHQEVIYKRPLAYQKMENLIKEMQDPEHGVPVRSQKLFLTSIPAAFAGYDVIEWLMERLTIEDSIEAIHLANLLCQHGYFFPVGDNRSLSVKDDSSLYRFQTPYYWPSQVPCLDSVDYAIWLVKRTLRNKQKHGLDDYEIEALNNLRKTLIQKWDFISMQADEQVRISKDRKKVDKMVTDSQERAFWRVLRPPPGLTSCVETPPMHMADFHANEGVKQIRRTNLIEDLRAEVDLLRISCLRSRTKVSQALESLATQCDSYSEHDPFLVARQPSNPWVTDDICFWVLNAPIVEIPTERRVKKWASSMEDLVFDPTGLREFTLYLKKEYCHENIRFWLAVRDLRYGPMSQLRLKAQQIYNEFLSPGAPCEINIDMRTMEAVQKEMNYFTPSRFTFDPAANHVYAMLLKKDCYPRFIRSENYKNLLANAIQPQKKRFFNFSAPIKKKSSATNPMIFPVGSQSATAGVGEVLRVTDEVILLTTGNKPSDFSASHTEPDVALPDVPYRGDIIPEAKNEVDSVTVTKALSQGSFDDVCPWESMEKLPEKDQKMSSSLTTKYDSPTPVTKSLHTITVTKATFIASKHTGSVPAMVGSIAPILQTSTLLPNTSSATSIQATNNKTTPQSASASALLVSPTSISTCTLSNAIEESKGMIGTAMCPNKSEPSSLIARALSVEKQTTNSLDAADLIQDVTILSSPSGFDNSNMEGALGIQGGIKALSSQSSVEKESLPLPLGTSASESSSEQNCGSGLESTANIIVLSKECPTNLNGDGRIHPEHRESLVDVCPWDHENGSQPESTTFTKTYSTLGYL